MTHATQENSTEGARPLELYRFRVGGATYEYTSSGAPITRGALTFEPIAISRSDDPQGPEDRDNVLEVEMPGDNPFAALYYNIVPGVVAELTIQRFHLDDPDDELITIFQGLVASVAFEDDGQVAKVAALPMASATSRPIPRFTFQALCNHVLYDPRCKVADTDPDFRLVGEVSAADDGDRTITVTGANSKPDGWWTGGFVEADSGLDRRMILEHVGNVLTLLLPLAEYPVGEDVTLYAGCDHTITTCKSKFDNTINYGGFAFIPSRNIFEVGLQ